MNGPENLNLDSAVAQEKSFIDKAKDVGRRVAIASLAPLVLSGTGCTEVQGRDDMSNDTVVSIETNNFSTETNTNSELKDVAPERLEFTKDLLNLYDESVTKIAKPKEFETAFNKIKDFISRDQIIEYGKTGETGENLSIVKHKDGSPAMALINCNDNVTNVFNEMLSEMSMYDPDYLDKMTDNGTVAFMVNRYDINASNNFTFNKSGLIVWNLKPERSEVVGSYALKRTVETECFGNKILNLGGDYAKYAGFIKEQLSSDCWWNLYKKTGDEFCRDMSYSSYVFCKNYYNEFYAPANFQDKKIQDLINEARKLVSLFGGTEAEISASIIDRPDWNYGDIE